MAYLPDDDKLKKPDDAQAQGSTSAPTLLGSGPSTVAGTGGGTGTGGSTANSQPWTNIQAYLQANQGNTSSADLANSKIGGAFDQEKQNLKTASTDAQTKSQAAVNSNKIGMDQASKMIENMGNYYNYGGSQQTGGPSKVGIGPDPSKPPIQFGAPAAPSTSYPNPIKDLNSSAPQGYQDWQNQFRNSLTSNYSGPDNFSYGMGTQAQNYGDALSDPNRFRTIMKTLYEGQAGQGLGTGMSALQDQLDTQNPSLENARQGLAGQYSGLKDSVTNEINNANGVIQANKGQYSTDQNDLLNYLKNQGTSNLKSVDDAVKSFNDEEGLIASGQKHPQLPGGPAATVDRNFYRFLDDAGPDGIPGTPDDGAIEERTNRPTDTSSYYRNYAPGQVADESNVGGVDDQRNRYNAIMDALGYGSKLGKADQTAQHGGYQFDQNAWDSDLDGLKTIMANDRALAGPGQYVGWQYMDPVAGKSTYDSQRSTKNILGTHWI